MKKKCRVYGGKKLLKAKDGLNVPAMTQDSQQDPVYKEKANQFMAKIQQYNQAAMLKQMQEAALGYGSEGNMMGYKQGGTAIPGYQTGGFPPAFGNPTPDYGSKPIANVDAFEQAAQPMNVMPYLNIMGKGVVEGAYNRQAAKAAAEAQTGREVTDVSYPGHGLELLPEVDEEEWDTSIHNPYATTAEAFAPFADEESGDEFTEDDYQTETDYNFERGKKPSEPGGDDDPFKKKPGQGIFGDMGGKKGASKLIAGMKIGEKLGNIISGTEAKRQKDYKRKISDPFEKFHVAGSDRGDYMANIPGMGEALRPDEHTLMGYNTKIAQDGLEVPEEDYMSYGEYLEEQKWQNKYPLLKGKVQQAQDKFDTLQARIGKKRMLREKKALKEVRQTPATELDWIKQSIGRRQEGGAYEIDDELELSEAEINNLIAQGYELEYLD